MTVSPYQINTISTTRYEFNSVGPKGTILKGVEITALQRKNTYNFGFGDVMSDGNIDDQSESNNNDLIRIFATIIEIMEDFITNNPSAVLLFLGSTDQRTTVYQYILQRYYGKFSRNFTITAILRAQNIATEVEYDPLSEKKYLAFLIKRKQ